MWTEPVSSTHTNWKVAGSGLYNYLYGRSLEFGVLLGAPCSEDLMNSWSTSGVLNLRLF